MVKTTYLLWVILANCFQSHLNIPSIGAWLVVGFMLVDDDDGEVEGEGEEEEEEEEDK